MPAFGKRQKEESINDKMVRLFKEGRSVKEISDELDVKPDVITNVIRRRCGEDSIPEKVVRSKNAMPHDNDQAPLKAEAAAPEQPAPEPEEVATEGMSKLEKLMLEKEKKRQENADAEAAAEAAEETETEEEPTMDEVSMEGISLDSLGTADPSIPEPVYADDVDIPPEPEMDGISAEDIPELSADTPIEEHPINEFDSGEEVSYDEQAFIEPEDAPAAEEKASYEPAPAVDVHMGGSAFDKMKAFALAQVEANNAKIAELEAKLGLVEGDYNAQLEEAEKAVEESKVKYEEVLSRSEKLDEERSEAQSEHRTAIARAEEEYRRKLAEVDDEYNNATAHANKVLAEKEAELNKQADTIDAEKETAKNDFLDNQSKVNGIKDKIAEEVDVVKNQIAGLKEENKGFESYMQ